jgi:recombination protein RecR
MSFSPLIDQLIESLRVLPGVGPRSAQKMALHLIERNPDGARGLAAALVKTMDHIKRCVHCRTFTESEACRLCANPSRDRSQLCIVETPMDIMAIEQSSGYQGLYFVLMGRLSPLDGIGPEELKLKDLHQKFQDTEIKEVILAINPTVEGSVTASYIMELMKPYAIKISRIAYGVPYGGELEYVDRHTLSHAFSKRQLV